MTGSSGTCTRRHSYTGIAFFSALHLVLFGIPGIIMIAVHLSAQPFFAGGVINGLGTRGRLPQLRDALDAPPTSLPWGLLLGGEELHNNHHAFPRSARFAVQRWELDIGWLWIRAVPRPWGSRGCAGSRRGRTSRTARGELDAETVKALFINRLHVLRAYARRVVAAGVPRARAARAAGLGAAERAEASHPPSGAARRGGAPPPAGAHGRYEVLRRVLEYREGLQQLWNDASANQARALAQLREWCSRAEASGISALRDFAQALPAYSALARSYGRAGRVVERVTVRIAKLDCTRATLGRRVRCWLWMRSKSAMSATTSRSR